ncbi:DUF4397 domain-containing protein [Pedobacter polaris]|uniref:DUF4397 domain-containing protein n=1 Tax=Pedobacter polaris TaxID=2571273 RepID=A0A4U1CPP0_9SPHI|nr:DUF4397 domain-containing protein [Pedobacter polaris]TKC10027.1 DUF4397 domain-containing protein [Pedobacter polaris]
MKTLTNKKPALLLMVISMFAILISSCKKDDDPAPIVYGDAKISVTNTASGSNAQDFYQGDTKLTTTAVAYTETSPYLTVKAGNSVLSFKNTGSTTNTASISVGLDTDASYTVFYYTNLAGTGLITGAGNDNIPPATGKVKVRFANFGAALNNTLNIGVTGGANLVTGLGFGNITNTYFTIDANLGLDFTVLNSGITVQIPSSNFVSGKIYTVWFDTNIATTAKFHVIQEN